jgi:hypothetical protein
MSDEERQRKSESERQEVGPDEPKYTWAKWDPVLAKKIISDNFEH